VLSTLRATQKCEQKEVEEQIAEQSRHLDNSKASYQNLIDDLQRTEIITKCTEGATASARAAIAKEQALIWDNKKKLANKKKRAEELEAARERVQ